MVCHCMNTVACYGDNLQHTLGTPHTVTVWSFWHLLKLMRKLVIWKTSQFNGEEMVKITVQGCVHTMHRSSPPFCLQNILLWNKIVSTNIYRRQHATKYFSFSKFWQSQNFENSKSFWAPFFGLWGYYPPFQNSFVAWGLTTYLYPDVSTTFPPSFFTVMPKGLTTGPKSRTDWSWPDTTATSWCILFDGENILFDASLVIYIRK